AEITWQFFQNTLSKPARKKSMTKDYICILLCLLLTLNVAAQRNRKPISVLIVDGFSNHDWKQTTKVTKYILEKSGLFTVEVSTVPVDSAGQLDWKPAFKKYAVVIQNTNNINNNRLRWPENVEKQLETYVKNGGGLYVLHSGNNSFPHWDAYKKMIGLGWRPKTFGYALEINDERNIVRIP